MGSLSDIGNIRKTNEDFMGYYEGQDKQIYVIADGMGGHNAGEIASKLAVDSTLEYIKAIGEVENIEEALKEAVQYSNSKVYDKSLSEEMLNGMGTTITTSLIVDHKVAIANVGDSRCYVMNKYGLHKVTKDHSLVQELIDNGSITAEEAASHPNKNIITRALGTHPYVEVDIYTLNTSDIVKIILCTDGLTNEISEDEIFSAICNKDNQSACEELVTLSKNKGGRDNISVIIIEGECKNDWDLTRE